MRRITSTYSGRSVGSRWRPAWSRLMLLGLLGVIGLNCSGGSGPDQDPTTDWAGTYTGSATYQAWATLCGDYACSDELLDEHQCDAVLELTPTGDSTVSAALTVSRCIEERRYEGPLWSPPRHPLLQVASFPRIEGRIRAGGSTSWTAEFREDPVMLADAVGCSPSTEDQWSLVIQPRPFQAVEREIVAYLGSPGGEVSLDCAGAAVWLAPVFSFTRAP